jgi:tripartite-type tricarboxylate transporter receptor subunit TctC
MTHRRKRMTFARRALLGAALFALTTGALAQPYPNKPIKMIVPFPPAGSTDLSARAVAGKLQERLGQPVVVENKPGAGGNIGGDVAAKSPPDGYTLFVGTVGTNAINAGLYSKMPYDHLKDFAPVILLSKTPNVLVLNPGVPANSVQELIKLAKSKPGEVTFASSGIGTSIHMSGELFQSMAGVKMTHIPYKGSGPMLIDIMSGQVNLAFDNLSAAINHIKSGSSRPSPPRARRALRRFPTCRPSLKRASRATTRPRGTRSSSRPELRRRSSIASTRSWTRSCSPRRQGSSSPTRAPNRAAAPRSSSTRSCAPRRRNGRGW